MSWDVDLSAVGSLLAEPARCRILSALIDGRALAATTVAVEARVAPSTASGHLRRLTDAGWLTVETHGRHRYYRLEREDVGELVEAAARVAPAEPVRSLAADVRRRQLRRARTCYGHLAGRLGVAVTDGLIDRGWIDGHDGSFRPGVDELSSTGFDVAYRVTALGDLALEQLGISAPGGTGVRHCVDWSEQRHHVAGVIGSRLTNRFFELGWLERSPSGRAVAVTETGATGLTDTLGIDISRLDDF